MAAVRLPTRHPRPGILQSPTHLLLGLLAMLLLAMPINYRAGTDRDHPHAFFQPVIDRITSHTHSHGEAGHDNGHAHGQDTGSATQRPDARLPDGQHDVPSLTTLKTAPDSPLAIVALGVLVLLLAAEALQRLDWPRTRVLEGKVRPAEPPPPRLHAPFAIVPPGS